MKLLDQLRIEKTKKQDRIIQLVDVDYVMAPGINMEYRHNLADKMRAEVQELRKRITHLVVNDI